MAVQERRRIGVLGGTFDPPHIAHLILADEARFQLDLSSVLWVLTPNSPLKYDRVISPWEERFELLSAAVKDDPGFQISIVDIDRPPPHYTFETLQIIIQEFPDKEIVFLMGGDSLSDLLKWKNPQQIFAVCSEIGVMRRPGVEINLDMLEREIPKIREKIVWVEAPLLDISGSAIRKRLRTGKPVRYFLPPAVHQIIEAKQYYQMIRED